MEIDNLVSLMNVATFNDLPEDVLDKYMEKELESLPTIIENIMSQNENRISEGVYDLRHLLGQKNPPVTTVIKTGVMPTLVSFLREGCLDHGILWNILWIITNIVAGSHSQTIYMIDLGIVPIIIDILNNSNDMRVVSSALWVVYNIKTDSLRHIRNEIEQYDIEDIILGLKEKFRCASKTYELFKVMDYFKEDEYLELLEYATKNG